MSLKFTFVVLALMPLALAEGQTYPESAPRALPVTPQPVISPSTAKTANNSHSRHKTSHSGAPVLTLKDCLQRALAQDPGILAVDFNVESLRRRAQAERASYLPQLVGDGQTGFVAGASPSALSVLGAPSLENDGRAVVETKVDVKENQITGPKGGTTTTSTNGTQTESFTVSTQTTTKQILGLNAYRNGGATLTMPLISGGSFFGINTPPAATEKFMEEEAAKYGGQLTTQQIIFQVTAAYLSVINAEHKLELLKREVVLSRDLLDIAKTQFKFGIITQFDLNSAETTLAEAEQAYDVDAGMAVESFLELSLMMGLDNPKSFSIDTTFPPMPQLPSYQFLQELTHDHQPAILQQEAIAKAADAQLTYDQDKIWPTFNYEGNYTYGDDYQRNGNTEWNTFFTVSVPIFDFGVLSDTAKADLAALKADRLAVGAAKEVLIQQLYAACSSIRDNTAALSGINSEVDSANKEQQKSVLLTQVDGITLVNAINTEQNYIHLRLTQEDQILHDMLAYAQLQQVLGGQWNWLEHPSKIKPSTALPQDHF